jgi:hypothetical protein
MLACCLLAFLNAACTDRFVTDAVSVLHERSNYVEHRHFDRKPRKDFSHFVISTKVITTVLLASPKVSCLATAI